MKADLNSNIDGDSLSVAWMWLGGEGSLKVMDLYELSLGKECVWPNGTHSPNQSDQSVMQSLTHSFTYQSNFIQALSFSYNIFYISLKQWSFSCCFNLCFISFAVFSHTLRKKFMFKQVQVLWRQEIWRMILAFHVLFFFPVYTEVSECTHAQLRSLATTTRNIASDYFLRQ